VVIHLGLALSLGSVASQIWLDGPGTPPSAWKARADAQALGLRRAGFAVGLVGVTAAAWFEAAAMGETSLASAGPALGALLAHTHFGRAWLAGLAAWILASTLLLRTARRVAWPVGLLALGVFAFTRSVVSHAGSQGDFTIDVAVDWLHLVLVCLWVGIVVVGTRLKLPDVASSHAERAQAASWVARMSWTATGVLAGIVVTGSFKVWRGLAAVGSFDAYVGSDYGRALVVKLLLVGVAAGLGGFNRFLVLPRVLSDLESTHGLVGRQWHRRLRRVLAFELITLFFILVAAAFLSSTELPSAG